MTPLPLGAILGRVWVKQADGSVWVVRRPGPGAPTVPTPRGRGSASRTVRRPWPGSRRELRTGGATGIPLGWTDASRTRPLAGPGGSGRLSARRQSLPALRPMVPVPELARQHQPAARGVLWTRSRSSGWRPALRRAESTQLLDPMHRVLRTGADGGVRRGHALPRAAGPAWYVERPSAGARRHTERCVAGGPLLAGVKPTAT